MTNTNESPMQRFMREKARQEHKEATQAFAKQGMNLQQYMQMIEMFGPISPEDYTEICEDFLEPIIGNLDAKKNLMYVDPIKYKINEAQYIRIFKTPLSQEGRLFVLVKPVEHKLSKKTYYELAKIAVSAEHYLARHNLDETGGPVYAQQIALVNPEFLEPGKYKEICIYAGKTNYRALKWMQYDKLSRQDFIDIFMAIATDWHASKWHGMNPAVFYTMDSGLDGHGAVWEDWRKDCYVAYAEKYGLAELESDYKRHLNGINLSPYEIDHEMLRRVRNTLAFKPKQEPQERKFTITKNDGPEWVEVCCKCGVDLEKCPGHKFVKAESCAIKEWQTTRIIDENNQIPQSRVDARLPNKADLEACKQNLNNIRCSCKFGHNR